MDRYKEQDTGLEKSKEGAAGFVEKVEAGKSCHQIQGVADELPDQEDEEEGEQEDDEIGY